MQKTIELINWIRPMLPENKTRYTMGVGLNPQNLIDVAAKGIDIFDCVGPTRNARHGTLYCGKIVKKNDWLAFVEEEHQSKVLIKKAIFAKDENPIMEDCQCFTCKNFTRAYLHYLFKQQAMIYFNLACIHNIFVMQRVCEAMRELILASE